MKGRVRKRRKGRVQGYAWEEKDVRGGEGEGG